MRELSFSPQRALESLLFLTKRLSNPTIHEVLKLRYFADKLHMSAYGFMASGDRYDAMRFGPVASNTYNMLKAARGERNAWIHPAFIELVQGNLVVDDAKVVALRDASLELLAPSDIECLEEALKRYGNMPFWKRTGISHDSAYKRAWKTASENSMDAGRMTVRDIASTLDNSAEVLEYISD